MSVHDWHDLAVCPETGSDLFFGPEDESSPAQQRRVKKAKTVCHRCPVKTSCLDYAIDTGQKYGIWGGLDPKERKAEAARRDALPPPPKPVFVVEKLCTCCGVIQPAAEFGKDTSRKTGLNPWCKECIRQAGRRRRAEAKQAAA